MNAQLAQAHLTSLFSCIPIHEYNFEAKQSKDNKIIETNFHDNVVYGHDVPIAV